DLADRSSDPTECLPEGHGRSLALVIEIALRGDVVEVDGVGVGLVATGGAVTDYQYQAAGTQGLRELLVVGHRHARREPANQCGQAGGKRQRSKRPARSLEHRSLYL